MAVLGFLGGVVLLAGLAPRPAAADAVSALQGLADVAFTPVGRDTVSPAGATSTTFAEDGRGFLWGAGQNGAFRWDGYTTVAFVAGSRRPDGLADHMINVLHRDREGTLWAGTAAAGLARYDAASDRFIAQKVPVAAAQAAGTRDINDIADDGEGGLLLATSDGLVHRAASGTVIAQAAYVWNSSAGGPPDMVRAVLRDRAGHVWAGGPSGLAEAPDVAGLRFVRVPLGAGGTQPQVSHLVQDQTGAIWIGTHDGAYVLAPGAAAPVPVAMPGTVLAAHEVMAMAEASAGEVWIGTYGEGIVAARADGATRHIVHDANVPSGLDSNVVFGLYRDQSGLMWVSTPFGISHAVLSPGNAILPLFDHPGANQGLNVEQPVSLLLRRDGTLWVGSESDGIEIIGQQGQQIGHVPVQPIVAMAEAPDGRVFAGGRGGAYVIDKAGRHAERLRIPGRGETATLWTLAMIGDTLWLGGDTDGVWIMHVAPDGTVQVSRHIQFPGGRAIYDIEALPFGRVGVASMNGLWIADPDGGHLLVAHADPADPAALPTDKLVCLETDSRGRLLVGTWDSGLAVLTGWTSGGKPRFTRLGMQDGLPAAGVDTMLADGHGHVWIATDNGLAVLDEASLTMRPLGPADGVIGIPFWDGSKARGNGAAGTAVLLFGGTGGMALVRPDRLTEGQYAPPVAVTRLLIDGKPVDTFDGATIILRPGQRSFSVDFAALDYADPARNRYRYRLDGFDQDWVETDSAHRIAAYTNLQPGHYTLWLSGSDRTGVWSPEVARLSLRVLPAWYQTWVFRIAAGLAVLAAVWALVRVRTRLLRFRQRALERQVAERTAELRESQARLERLAHVDPLTGLPNRRAFNDEVRRMCATRRPDFALALMDLDGFKPVNDTLGHDAGDAVLILTASRLRDAVRSTDFVARLGGDEFAILLAEMKDLRTAEQTCDRIIAAMSEPTLIGGRPVQVGASVGIALYPRHGESVEALYKSADLALYDAKRAGRGTWRWFTANMAQAS